VLAGGAVELDQQRLELRLADVELAEPAAGVPARALLADRRVGQLVAVGRAARTAGQKHVSSISSGPTPR
jgi:hypothetical protein